MRRIVMWFMSTLTAVVLLFGYHTSTSGPTSATSAVIGSGSDVPSGSLTHSSSGSTSSSSGSSAQDTTVTGSTAQTRWGPVQVQITVAGGTITAVNVPVYPTGNPTDQEINSSALPQLIQETLDAQSADIDMVSGATVTSDGYLQSLQAALDEAGL